MLLFCTGASNLSRRCSDSAFHLAVVLPGLARGSSAAGIARQHSQQLAFYLASSLSIQSADAGDGVKVFRLNPPLPGAKSKVRPSPVSPGSFFVKESLRVSLPRHLLTAAKNNTEGPQYAFSRKGGIYRSNVVSNPKPNPGPGPTASRWPARSPGKKKRREDHAFLIVRDEFRTGYSLIRLLASRLTCSPQTPRLKGTFLFCLDKEVGGQ
jgi:hypothetical protein